MIAVVFVCALIVTAPALDSLLSPSKHCIEARWFSSFFHLPESSVDLRGIGCYNVCVVGRRALILGLWDEENNQEEIYCCECSQIPEVGAPIIPICHITAENRTEIDWSEGHDIQERNSFPPLMDLTQRQDCDKSCKGWGKQAKYMSPTLDSARAS